MPHNLLIRANRSLLTAIVFLLATLIVSHAIGATPIEPVDSVTEKTDVGDMLSVPLDVCFEQEPLDVVVGALSMASDLDIIILPEAVSHNEVEDALITLRMSNASVRGVLDWLTRMLDARYRIMPGKIVRIYSGESSKRKEQLETLTYPTGTYALMTKGLGLRYEEDIVHDGTSPPALPSMYDFAEERERLINIHHTLLRYIEERYEGTRLVFGGSRTQLIAHYPRSTHEKIGQIATELSRWADRSMPSGRFRRKWLEEGRKRLTRKVSCDVRQLPFHKLINMLADQVEISIGWNSLDPSIESSKPITLRLDNVPFNKVLRGLLLQVGLDRGELEWDKGLWLHRKDDPPLSVVPQEYYWDACFVRSYFVGPLLSQHDSDALIAMIQESVTPSEWEEAPPAMAFHRETMRLLVLHTPSGQEQVADYLRALAVRLAPGTGNKSNEK